MILPVTEFVDRNSDWKKRLSRYTRRAQHNMEARIEGKLVRMVGLTMEAVGCQAAVGAQCLVVNPNGSQVEAEVVGFSGEKLFLMPTGSLAGLVPNARVI
ncbi:MAG: flagellum-specific ATP synthase FliI, partial [Gammaproteobacteria bacterium]|nr:flagellum-specific ATP synthase FliI [Gammaproteobacteria bacterium]